MCAGDSSQVGSACAVGRPKLPKSIELAKEQKISDLMHGPRLLTDCDPVEVCDQVRGFA
jgi:hypothetical protein